MNFGIQSRHGCGSLTHLIVPGSQRIKTFIIIRMDNYHERWTSRDVYTYFWLVCSLGTREEVNGSTPTREPKEARHRFTWTRVRVRAVRSVDRLLAIRPVESWNRSSLSFYPFLSLSFFFPVLFLLFRVVVYEARDTSAASGRVRDVILVLYYTGRPMLVYHMVPYWRSWRWKSMVDSIVGI